MIASPRTTGAVLMIVAFAVNSSAQHKQPNQAGPVSTSRAEAPTSAPLLTGDPASLSLLGDNDVHLFVQEAYEVFSPSVSTAVEGRYLELVGAGMDTARHLFDWSLLETSAGVYDTQEVIDAMDYRRSLGIEHQFCNLVVIDTESPTVPQYIADLLSLGTPWDDPLITAAFAKMLDVFVPIMLQRDMYLLGLSNEPSGYYEDFPSQAASFKGFVREAIRHAHELESSLSCSVVFAGPGDMAIGDLMPLIDVASFNQYFYFNQIDPTCLFGGFFPLEVYWASAPAMIGAQLDGLIQVAQGKLICIQEIGQSTGWNDMPTTMGPLASLGNQSACYAELGLQLDLRRKHFRTVCNWTLNDHSQQGIQYLGDLFSAQGFPPCFGDNLMEIFGPTGLVHSDAIASKKPAFDQFKQVVASFAQ